MGESFKAVCALVLIVIAAIAAVAWSDDQPNSMTWLVRGVASLLAVLVSVRQSNTRKTSVVVSATEMVSSFVQIQSSAMRLRRLSSSLGRFVARSF
jgi:hypothetical protein